MAHRPSLLTVAVLALLLNVQGLMAQQGTVALVCL